MLLQSLVHLGIVRFLCTSLMFITPETVKISKAQTSFTSKTKNLSKNLNLQSFVSHQSARRLSSFLVARLEHLPADSHS
jgi:hypothetical protein